MYFINICKALPFQHVALATFQVLNGHIWLVATILNSTPPMFPQPSSLSK